jgi:ABC-type phosphate transport system substrate-binding protein
MKKQGSLLTVLLALAIFASAAAHWIATDIPAVHAGGDPIVVIVNVSNSVDNLSMGDLKKIYLSDRSHWDSGKPIAPVMVSGGAPERTAFLKIVCGMSDGDFGKYFMQAAFSGKSVTAPKEVGNAQGVKAAVASSPGAIGFVKAQDFHGDGSDGGVKAVKIDGMAAADAGYKIRM